MTKWVNMTLEVEVAVPLENIGEVAPGISSKELLALLHEDPDRAEELLKENLIPGDAVTYATDVDIINADLTDSG